MAERHRLRFEFWKGLLERANKKTSPHESFSPQTTSWIGTVARKNGLSYNYVIAQNDARVELYIDRGKDLEQENKTIFENRKEIEEDFGHALECERLDTKRASRIKKKMELGGYKSDKEK